MDILHGLDSIPSRFTGALATIGNFDGVHRGHQHLFRRLAAEAHAAGKPAMIITFDPHPKMLLHPERRPFHLLTTLPEKAAWSARQGIDALLVLPFSLDFARITAEDFVRNILWGKLRVAGIIIGHDYTFGHGKKGNEALLRTLGGELGFSVEAVEAFSFAGGIVSSTRIRNCVLEGDVAAAGVLLGRPYNLAGPVVPGHHRGASLGFPTANIAPEKTLIPPEGVYAAWVRLEGKTYAAAVNIGANPTFGDGERAVEAFLLDFQDSIYGKRLEILFVERLREERTFADAAALVAQIRRDVDRARQMLITPPRDEDFPPA